MWISAESAALLQRLADEQGQPKNRIIEWALSVYATGEPTSNDTSDLLDWRTELSNRVLALETRLGALEAVGAIGVGAVERKACSAACEPVGVVLETVDAEPGIEKVAANQNDVTVESSPAVESDVVINQNKAAFDAAVIAAYKSGITKGADILRHVTTQGYRNSEGNAYYRSGVEHTLKRAGLKD